MTLVGQAVTKRMETKTQRELREAERTELVYDRRLDYEVLRRGVAYCLGGAHEVAHDGRRLARQAKSTSQRALTQQQTQLETFIRGPIDLEKAWLFEPRMSDLKAVMAVTVDDHVGSLATEAFKRLRSGDGERRAIEDALEALGERRRKIQGKVPWSITAVSPGRGVRAKGTAPSP